MAVRCAALAARARVLVSVVALAAAGLTGLGIIAATPAQADTSPDPGLPTTMSADALPTVQQNGVVWSEVTVGNTVYATGNFSQAWPAGVSQGGAGTVSRNNLLAFDIRTGNLITSFNHSLNAQGLAIKASPDGSRIYVGGDFTTVDGATRQHIAAFDTATGALVTSFHPNFGSQVRAIAATNSTVYVGGNFFSVNGVARTRLAAVSASNGALLSWAPTADGGFVAAMVMTPDQSHVVVGGRFQTISGVNEYGLGAVDATTAAALPFAMNSAVRDYGDQCGINSLSTDGNQIYGSGFAFGCGNFEGTFAAEPDTGNIVWINDCHGDTYDTFSTGSVLYSVSHAHECSEIGEFPDTNPRVWHHALASTTTPGGVNIGPDSYGWNYNGIPASKLLHWYPALGIGSVTGQGQAAWAATGNSQYLALGGEFPTANGKAQRGLVRYALPSIAPDKVGPRSNSTLTPNVVSLASGTARLAWTATWDYDNENLTYNILRDGSNTPIGSVTQKSNFWKLPSMGYLDKGLTPGSTHTYRIQVVDANGNKVSGGTSNSVTISSASPSTYASDVINDGASDYWRLGEASGTTGFDWAGFSDLAEGSGVSHGASGAINGDTDGASGFDGTDNGNAATTGTIAGPNVFSIESWIKTTTNSGGKVVGFGSAGLGGASNSYDRHIYLDNSGHVIFGVYNNGTYTITSPNTYNDGSWHQIVGTLSSNGMALYIDGKKIGQNQGTTVGQPYNGYWRIGGDNLNGWPSRPSSNNFNGSIDDVAIYPTALSLANVQQHYIDSGRTLNIPTAPADNYGKTVFNDGPDLYWRLDDANGPTAADSSINGATGVYSGGVTYQVGSTVTGPTGTAVQFNGSDGTIGSSTQVQGPSVYSEEAWFNTTTTHGGKIIGFGNQQSGSSSNYDRHVYMENSGQLTFGVWTGFANTVTSPQSYSDGNWHHVVATQGPDGMHLYVDGVQVGANPQTQAQPYSGYWRVGGDSDWGGDSPYFAGKIDEVAVYSYELTPDQVRAHFRASNIDVNQAPTAAFASNCTNLSCSFDASGSSDADGSIASYSWDFGDGTAAGSGVSPNHDYTNGGTDTVTLTVTDDQGGTNSVSHSVTVTAPPNQLPKASFTEHCTSLSCSFDGSGSSDTDGSIASYSWDFGDGTAAGGGVSPNHDYANDGTYTVKLTVTDNRGGTDTASHDVTVAQTPNQAPTAAFTPTCTELTCAFDASASADQDGSIASYAWDFGDGSNGSGVSPNHSYPAAGDYSVTLTVTDNQGATGTKTVVVSPRPPANPPTAPFASDNFNRSVTNGWGTADTGGAWTVTGAKSNFSTNNGTGFISLPNPSSGPTIQLNDTSSTDASTMVNWTVDKVANGNGTYFYVTGRRTAPKYEYRAAIRVLANGSLSAAVTKLVNSNSATVIGGYHTVPNVTFSPGMLLKTHFVVSGTNPTTLQLNVWPANTTEPNGWLINTTDSTNELQSAGSVGVGAFLSGTTTNAPVTVSVSSYTVRPTVAPPTAAFATLQNALAVSVNGSGSSDPSGTISSYTWSWADGAITHGMNSSHTYASAGTYRITLTVTDPSGWTDVATGTVTVSP